MSIFPLISTPFSFRNPTIHTITLPTQIAHTSPVVIASGQYFLNLPEGSIVVNGQTLLDGSKNDQVIGEKGTGTYTHLTNESFQDGTKTDTRLTNLKRKDVASVGIQVGDHITVSYIKDGKTYSSRNSTVGETIVSKTTRFGNIFDWSPCDTDLDIVHYSETSKIGLDRMAEPVYTLDGLSAISYHAKNPGLDGQISGLTICVTDSKGNPKTSANATINNFHETIRAEDPSEDNALVFQTGTKANQSVKIGFTDMRATALGLKSSAGNTIQLTTQVGANTAINAFDNAVSKALDLQTKIGSVQNRLGYTEANLVTASENVLASKSTISDADMAKEMTSYTKNNILSQAAQAMLAQANQSSSSVLSLLQ